jgi:dihydrofolate reductase
MSNVIALITTSVDGYITAPNDGPGSGLGDGGEALHNWVFGGEWHYADETRGKPADDDAAWFEDMGKKLGAVVCGRNTYEAAGHWGERNPFGVPLFVVTHRPEEQPDSGGFTFIKGTTEALRAAIDASAGKDVHVMGGADVIRQALAAGLVTHLTLIVSPLVLGSGKRLFDGFEQRLELEQLGARQSRFATFLDYRVS